MAERIIAKLRRKVPKFALMVTREQAAKAEVATPTWSPRPSTCFASLGHSESDARRLLDGALSAKQKYKNVQGLLQADLSTEPWLVKSGERKAGRISEPTTRLTTV